MKVFPRILKISLAVMVILSSGCATKAPEGSWIGLLPTQGAVEKIADDAVSILSGTYPPGHTTLYPVPADRENSFSLAFESKLRAAGYTVTGLQDSDVLTIIYTLDPMDENTAWYLQFRLSDGNAIARAYTAYGEPEAGTSHTTMEFKWSRWGEKVDQAGQKIRHIWNSETEDVAEAVSDTLDL